MGFWSDPTDCLTEAEEAAMEQARKDDLEHSWQLMMDEAFEALASLDDTLANMPPLDPDALAMATEPAATCAGAVNLLDAMNARKDAAA